MLIPIAINLIIALILLIILAIIDLRTRLLPNIYVFPLMLLGVFFHITTEFSYNSPDKIALGFLASGGLLLLIRTIANHIYNQDTLGLGDIKLIAAAGIWLGIDYIFIALSLGALFGVVHSGLYALYLKWKTGHIPPLNTFSIPAGPGFIGGILITALFKFLWT